MQSREDNKEPKEPDDEADHEPREYSSPACYLHEFEQQAGGADQARAPTVQQPAVKRTSSP